MHDNDTYEIINVNDEKIIPKKSKNIIDKAFAIAIAQGAQINYQDQSNVEVIPRVGLECNEKGSFLGVELSISFKKTKTYKMRE